MPFSVINEQAILFITTNVKNRRWYFVTPERAASLGQAIQTCCDLKGFELLAFCILPNHVHMLVRRRTLESVPQKDMRGNTTERKLGSMCSIDVKDAFLFPHRRLPSHTLESMRPEVLGELPPLLDRQPKRTLENVRPHRDLQTPDRRLSSRRPHSLSNLLQSIKGTFSRSLPKGTFWQRRSYVLHVESENYLDTLINYIRFNYTKMNLPESYGQVPFVFINNKNLHDLF